MCAGEKVEDLAFPSEDEVVYFADVGYREDLHKIHKKIDDLAKLLPSQGSQERAVHWYGNPLLVAIVGIIGSGLVAYLVARWQVNQAREEAALDQRIDGRIDLKLQPIGKDISKLREDMAYLKAKVEDATTRKIVGFSKLQKAEVQASLVDISKTIEDARTKQIISPPGALIELRDKLAQVQPRNHVFWVAFSNVISYQSLIAEKMGIFPNVEKARNQPCSFLKLAPAWGLVAISSLSFRGCGQKLDNGSWKDITFEGAIVTYDGGPVRLENVTFKNCIFEISFPGSPPPPAQKVAEALLSATGLVVSFNISTG
jgi:hypothetical protein